jgi:hypothetical protein
MRHGRGRGCWCGDADEKEAFVDTCVICDALTMSFVMTRTWKVSRATRQQWAMGKVGKLWIDGYKRGASRRPRIVLNEGATPIRYSYADPLSGAVAAVVGAVAAAAAAAAAATATATPTEEARTGQMFVQRPCLAVPQPDCHR